MSAAASPLPDKAPPGFRAVFIREEDFLNILAAGELVGLKDPANAFAAWVLQGACNDAGNLVELAEDLAENQRNEREAGGALRLAEADELARSLGLARTVTEIVLGDLARDPVCLGEIITENFTDLSEEDLDMVQQTVERWKAEDAGEKGGRE